MDYNRFSFRFVDVGLNLRDVADKVSEGRWTILSNCTSFQEGLLQTRLAYGIVHDTTNSGATHTIKRYGASSIFIGAGTTVYHNTTPLAVGGWTGEALSPVTILPPAGAAEWLYVADGTKSSKFNGTTELNWGIAEPTVAASAAATNTGGGLNSGVFNASNYDWRYTFYNDDTGAESNPSPIGTAIAVTGTDDSANVTITISADAQVSHINLYRRGGVNDVGRSIWRFVSRTAQGGGPTQVIADALADSAIAANIAMDLDNYLPFQSVNSSGTAVRVKLASTFGPFLGEYILGVGDTNRPGELYWTNKARPDGADIANHVSVSPISDPLVGGLIFNSQPFAFSRDNIYAIDYGGATSIPTFSGRKTPSGLGTISAHSFCVGPEIYFFHSTGIYATTGFDRPVSISEEHIRPIFYGQTVGGLSPIALDDASDIAAIRLAYGNDTLHFFYKGVDNQTYHLIYDFKYARWRQESSLDGVLQMAYNDENQSKQRMLMGTGTSGNYSGSVWTYDPAATFDPDTGNINCNARTGSLDMGLPNNKKEYGGVIVDADTVAGSITATPYINSEATALATTNLNSAGVGGSREKFFVSLAAAAEGAYSLAMDFTWSSPGTAAKIYQMEILWRPEEPEIRHWAFQETAHGLSGWQHIRDAYICLRSNATVVMTITVDGTAYTYNLATTAGAKRKVYVPLQPTKGKVFRYDFDCASADFRLYGDECEVRVRPWNSQLGYQLLNPFAEVG